MISRLINSPGRRAACLATLLLAGTAIVPFASNWALPVNAATPPPTIAGQLPGGFADLVESVSPAVVSIVGTQPAPERMSGMPGCRPVALAPFFRDFGFREFGGPSSPPSGTPAPDTQRHDALTRSGLHHRCRRL
ncbi:MAG: hypothetical protein R3D25_03385 [Geminicoccaceae bacterium]